MWALLLHSLGFHCFLFHCKGCDSFCTCGLFCFILLVFIAFYFISALSNLIVVTNIFVTILFDNGCLCLCGLFLFLFLRRLRLGPCLRDDDITILLLYVDVDFLKFLLNVIQAVCICGHFAHSVLFSCRSESSNI